MYDLLGREVMKLVDAIQDAGFKSVEWNPADNLGKSLASGLYFCRMEAVDLSNPVNSFVQVRKMVYIRWSLQEYSEAELVLESAWQWLSPQDPQKNRYLFHYYYIAASTLKS